MDAQTILAMISASKELETGNDSDSSSTPSEDQDSQTFKSDSPSYKEKADVQTMTLAEIINLTAESRSTIDPSKAVASAKPTRESRIKRPMNAFMVWSQQRRQQIAATGQKFHNSDISKMLGAEWRTMAEHEKIPFVERAKQLREEHFVTYPDYVYRPRRRKRIEKSTGSVDSVSTDEASGSPTMNAIATPYANFMAALALMLRNNQLTPKPSTD
ncbi:hypothetical protein CAEBREN_11452 [Caenorhabditis brenneri]|uniref:Sex-determining region Y protein n=1 Tax=Caenorhabditis brenneri TaxID=135651 RepID=G0M7N8_CAEBE|nr:hypothetical protein CAEBREN_11452 [Caenorhabditis brenneri]